MEEGPEAYLLSNVRAVIPFADGTIAVANGGTREVRVYSAGGTHVATYGRAGRGPGEFLTLSQLWAIPPDTLLVYDASLHRLTVFGPQGRVAATHGVPPLPGEAAPAHVLGRFADGTLLLKSIPITGLDAAEGPSRDTAAYARWTPSDGEIAILARLPEAERWVVRDDGGVTGYEVPFAPRPQVAAGTDAFVFTSGDGFEIERRDLSGEVHVLIRRGHSPLAVTREQIAARRAEMAAAMDPAGNRRWEEALARWGTPDFHGAVSRLLVSASGLVWARVNTPDHPARSLWSVFDPGGTWLSDVEMPSRFVPLFIDGEDLFGVAFEPDTDVEQIHVYALPESLRRMQG